MVFRIFKFLSIKKYPYTLIKCFYTIAK